MNKGGYRMRADGFTIVETLIVLAVTTALFVAIAGLVNGRQNRVQFQVGINDLAQQFQQIINQTSSGYYPNSQNFQCTAGTLGQPPTITPGTNSQGSNSGCVFIGNTIVFGDTSNTSYFTVYPMAANRLDLATNDVPTSVAAARPVAVAPGVISNPSAPADQTKVSLTNGLSYVGGRLTGNPGFISAPSAFAFSFMSDLSEVGFSSANNTLNSGSQKLALYTFYDPWLGQNTVDRIDKASSFASSLHNPYARQEAGLQLCFSSGGTNQSGLITIGGNGSLAVTTQVLDGSTC